MVSMERNILFLLKVVDKTMINSKMIININQVVRHTANSYKILYLTLVVLSLENIDSD